METTKKALVGGLCLLACTVGYAQLSSVHVDLRRTEVDTLARLYASAAPYALITPVAWHVPAASTFFGAETSGTNDMPVTATSGTDEAPEPVAASDDSFAIYITLHNTRVDSLPWEIPVFASPAPGL